MRVFRTLILLILTVSVSACGVIAIPVGAPAASAEEEPDAALIARGVMVYRENYCGTCHALDAADTCGTEHLTLPSYTGEAMTAAAYIRESIVNPSAFYTPGYEATNHHMPAFTNLSESDVEALVYLLVNQD